MFVMFTIKKPASQFSHDGTHCLNVLYNWWSITSAEGNIISEKSLYPRRTVYLGDRYIKRMYPRNCYIREEHYIRKTMI